jgi:hypothetical protein
MEEKIAEIKIVVDKTKKKEQTSPKTPVTRYLMRSYLFLVFYAAEAAAARSFFDPESPSHRTLTSFETPGSCMVTP